MKKKATVLLTLFLSVLLAGCSSVSQNQSTDAGQADKKISLFGDLKDEDKIYGLSLLWKEASYNFAFWDKRVQPEAACCYFDR
jgi:hypothetical protein